MLRRVATGMSLPSRCFFCHTHALYTLFKKSPCLCLSLAPLISCRFRRQHLLLVLKRGVAQCLGIRTRAEPPLVHFTLQMVFHLHVHIPFYFASAISTSPTPAFPLLPRAVARYAFRS